MENKDYTSLPADGGSIKISEEVIATIALEALSHTEGVVLPAASGNKQHAKQKTIRVKVEDGNVTISAAIFAAYGTSVLDAAKRAQSEVTEAVGAMTGLTVSAVNVTVIGIAFRKAEKQ
ncbi:MAG: Asp23/Gls24 family envelope stress response protein [Oscillospiraceae bacterium]|jgi:uncharacterized alkaline shock family protein YloU|nr:Asp23/Gls24 family envelope stress response protein [Oscillospiraceae bacterium]